ncbi:glycosyltransferase family 9 protein [Micromonospora okii]|uniref:glycosyltransferase family 9 protein n=1 Tax=Micromonospora okii TaxID=1182970 RepID=UPI001E532C87|nr:glycosyltransferase family 9 protein [Micromonospora okii]
MQRNILLAVLRRAHPHAMITLVVGRSLADRHGELLRGHTYADDLLCCPDPRDGDAGRWRRFGGELAGQGFDLCLVDPGSYHLDATHARVAGIATRVGLPRGDGADGAFTDPVTLPPPLLGTPDLYDYALGYGRALGLPAPLRAGEVVPAFPRYPEPVPELAAPAPRIALHPGGEPHWNRRWPLTRYAALAERLVARLGASIYLLGGAGEEADLSDLAGALRDRCPGVLVHVVAGAGINRMANLLAGVSLLVGNDSGYAHVAAAVGTPTVVIYGPTGTERLWSRVYPRHRGVSLHRPCQAITHGVDEVADRRCAHECVVEYRGSGGPYPRCLLDVSVSAVWTAVVGQLHGAGTTMSGVADVG